MTNGQRLLHKLCGSVAVVGVMLVAAMEPSAAQKLKTANATASEAKVEVASTGADPQSEMVKQRLKSAYPNTPFTEVRPSGLSGIYEVVMGRNVAYTDDTGRYFFFGQLMDMKTQRNLTTERSSEITKIDVKALKAENAIKVVKGDGSRVMYVFADPECGYCKQLEKTLAGVTNATIYTFLFPVLGERSMAEAQDIWCAADREKAYQDHMVNGKKAASAKCDNPISENLAIGQKFGITGTPTVITAAGRMAPGAPPPDRIEALLNDSPTAKVAKGQQ